MTVIRRDADRLMDRLPALYRIEDASRGHQLRALLRLVTAQADDLRRDTAELWDDFFIETCSRWVIPYIGDLVGNDPLHDLDVTASGATAAARFGALLTGPEFIPPQSIRLRADVAKTIYYRRRKGTPAMLEELARDVTGWSAHVVEFFQRLDWEQHLEHVRPECQGCPDLRRADVGMRTSGPWDTTAHTVDLRRIDGPEGWYHPRHLGVFLWRLGAYRISGAAPRAIGGTDWRLTFSPLGHDAPLWGAGRREPGDSRLATELTVEAPIRPAAFFEDLARLSAALPATASSDYYGKSPETSFVVRSNGQPVAAAEIACANLSAWTGMSQPGGRTILVDVARGRLVVPAGRTGETVDVDFCHGFSAGMGGGEYTRRNWLVAGPVTTLVKGGGTALQTALAARPAAARSIIRIDDSLTYVLTGPITLTAGEHLAIEASDERRPHVRLAGGELSVDTADARSSLTLGGLLIEGGLHVTGDLETLRLLHTTLVPGRSVEQEAGGGPTGLSLLVDGGTAAARINSGLTVEIAHSVVGALRIPSHVAGLWLLDSLVLGVDSAGAAAGVAIDDGSGGGPPAHVERSTVIGSSRFLKTDQLSESIFTDRVEVDQQQHGCVRFSFVPRQSKVPQQYRCQPSMEIHQEQERRREDARRLGLTLPSGWEAVVADEVGHWLAPSFGSERYGHPAFGQLRYQSPRQIRTGAEDGAEMGAFCQLKQPQRESNLRMRLNEYLPVGLEAGIIYVT